MEDFEKLKNHPIRFPNPINPIPRYGYQHRFSKRDKELQISPYQDFENQRLISGL
jgi:hypothetical protein